jgi:hypothetical protein
MIKQIINVERAFWPIKRWRFVPLLDVEMVKESYRRSREDLKFHSTLFYSKMNST